MPDQPSLDRFKAEMPSIPGVSGGDPRRPGGNPATRLVIGVVLVLVVGFLGARWALQPKHAEAPAPDSPPQIEVPTPEPDPNAAMPHATESEPGIATVGELAKPWASKNFFIKNRLTGENIPAIIIRLPGGSGSLDNSYWALSLLSPYGNCQLEYLEDLDKLKSDYGFRAAKHPMVGNPCSRTVFDPLRLGTVPGNVIVRGAIAQGSDLRPPLGIELKIKGKNILAVRME